MSAPSKADYLSTEQADPTREAWLVEAQPLAREIVMHVGALVADGGHFEGFIEHGFDGHRGNFACTAARLDALLRQAEELLPDTVTDSIVESSLTYRLYCAERAYVLGVAVGLLLAGGAR